MTIRHPTFHHVLAMSDRIGMFEHADHTEPRRNHGYCTDDMARLLVVIVREPRPSRAVVELSRTTFRFLAKAQGVTGLIRNRCTTTGLWHGPRTTEDCWGRSLWAFGSAARFAPEDWMRQSALAHFGHGASQSSPWVRSMAFAALGAGDVLTVDPYNLPAREILDDAASRFGANRPSPTWPWPENRLTYANAVIPEAMLIAGTHLDRPELVDQGLTLLDWLLQRETRDGHLSPTPAKGAGPKARDFATFDQQPIEVAAMADACARAFEVTGDNTWLRGIDLAARWFDGDNDAGALMWDPATGGGYDGLEIDGPNLNEGAESTLALISVFQQWERLHAGAPA